MLGAKCLVFFCSKLFPLDNFSDPLNAEEIRKQSQNASSQLSNYTFHGQMFVGVGDSLFHCRRNRKCALCWEHMMADCKVYYYPEYAKTTLRSRSELTQEHGRARGSATTGAVERIGTSAACCYSMKLGEGPVVVPHEDKIARLYNSSRNRIFVICYHSSNSGEKKNIKINSCAPVQMEVATRSHWLQPNS